MYQLHTKSTKRGGGFCPPSPLVKEGPNSVFIILGRGRGEKLFYIYRLHDISERNLAKKNAYLITLPTLFLTHYHILKVNRL